VRCRGHLEVEAQVVEHLASTCHLWVVDDALGRCELTEQLLAHHPCRADDGDGELRVREGESGMRGAESLGAVLLLDADRDLALRRALRNGAHIDARVGHRFQEGGT
jgi:hypothetical protein